MRPGYWFLLGGAIVTGCAVSADKDKVKADRAKVAGYELSLATDRGACTVTYSGAHKGAVTLQIPPPCSIHRDSKQQPRAVRQRDATVLLVESSRPHPDGSKDCDTRLQAIILRADGVTASRLTDKVRACPPTQWDEQIFGYFAEQGPK